MGYKNAMEKSVKLLADLVETTERTINSGLDIKYFILFTLISIIPFIAMLLIRVRQLKNSSVIELINNNKKKILQEEAQDESFEVAKATTISTELAYEEKVHTEVMKKVKETMNNEKRTMEDNKHIVIKNSKKSLKIFSLNHTLRSKFTSILLVILAITFTFSLLWMNYLNIKNNDLIDKVYKENAITADIITKDDESSWVEAGPINGKHIENLFNTGLVQDYVAIVEMYYKELYIKRDGVVRKYETGEKDTIHFFTRRPTFVVYANNKNYSSDDTDMAFTELDFMEDYSLNDFDREYIGDYSNIHDPIIIDEKGEEGFPVLASNKAMEHFDLELGDKIFLEPNPKVRNLSIKSYGTIVGTFKEIDMGKDFYGYPLIQQDFSLFIYPISALEAIEEELYYNKLEFEFNPEKNKELMERKDELRKIVANNPFNEFPTELRLWDGELTNVIEPLEKNLSLLEVLYPITFILSIIIAGILSFIMVLRRTLDVAILRVLGVKEKEVRKSLFMENIILTLIGIIIATIIMIIITSSSYSIPLVKYANIIGGYLLGTIIGLILSIWKVTNKKPLEMLQVKE
jgi:ABC-type antimicrobial peptide transport system permease subunit